jgi:hypothetical protein
VRRKEKENKASERGRDRICPSRIPEERKKREKTSINLLPCSRKRLKMTPSLRRGKHYANFEN